MGDRNLWPLVAVGLSTVALFLVLGDLAADGYVRVLLDAALYQFGCL